MIALIYSDKGANTYSLHLKPKEKDREKYE